jgi:NADH-quinone oxidoreductase subunit J
LGYEFLPILFIVVYVGAIAILFLFVVMLLNVKLVEMGENTTRYAPIGVLIGLVLLIEILRSLKIVDLEVVGFYLEYLNVIKETNIDLLGSILYTEY